MSRASILLVLALGCGGKHASSTATDAGSVPSTIRPATTADTAAVEARLSRLERTVDKLVAAIDKSLPPVEPDPATVYSVPIDPRDPVDGPADAKVTIVAVVDFMDPYSAMVAGGLAQVLAKHPADVRVVWKYLPVHGAPAIGAGLVACGAGKQQKWPAMRAAMLGKLFTGQPPQPHPEFASFDQLRALAVATGLDGARLEADRATCEAWFATTKAMVEPLGIHTTPALFINGRYAGGARDVVALEGFVAVALAAAQKRIAEGVVAADYYQREVVEAGAKRIAGRFE